MRGLVVRNFFSFIEITLLSFAFQLSEDDLFVRLGHQKLFGVLLGFLEMTLLAVEIEELGKDLLAFLDEDLCYLF